ncbi:MAG TPA: ATP-binding cassette domain-containing protein [bacterium]|nr:ATP-binding cassette domain-containing protein [bacterium]
MSAADPRGHAVRAGAPAGAALRVEQVVAGYQPEIDVLAGVTLAAAPGRITAVIGANGAGKSTLLRVVFGLLPARAGRVLLDGRDLAGLRPDVRKRLGVGYVPQGGSTFPQMTVDETLRLGGWTLRRHPAALRERLAHVYELFPALGPLRRRRTAELSGGQLRLLSVAKELVVMPSLLLVDEPTAGLAPRVAGEVYALLEHSRTLGITVLLVDQNIVDAVRVADDVYLFGMGRVQREGPRASFAADLAGIVRSALVGAEEGRQTDQPGGGGEQ